jgi:putative tricarboxylic transport membrane protein
MAEGTTEPAAPPRPWGPIRRPQDLIGGLLLGVLGLLGVVTAQDLPAIPGFASGLSITGDLIGMIVAVLGGVIAVQSMFWDRPLIRNPRDYFGGLALVAIALLALWASRDLTGMRGIAFGPGTAPRLFASILAVLGIFVAIEGVLTVGPPVERYAIRGPVFVTASILIFATTVRPLGLVISSFATLLAAAAATPEVRWGEAVIMAAAVTVFCALLFPFALGLPMGLWPVRPLHEMIWGVLQPWFGS